MRAHRLVTPSVGRALVLAAGSLNFVKLMVKLHKFEAMIQVVICAFNT